MPTYAATTSEPDAAVTMATQRDLAEIFEPTATARLVGALADGAFHPLHRLAAVAFGRADDPTIAHVRRMLAELAADGMPLAITDDGARARPFIALDERVVAGELPHWRVRVAGATGSTNTDLVRALRDGTSDPLPTLRAVEVQTAGRGRLGKIWRSGPGISLTASYALAIARKSSMLEGATLVCGLAVRDVALAEGVAATLKWPNDVLVGERKLAGILVEAHAASRTTHDGATAIVVGVGLNIAPAEGQSPNEGGLPPIDLVGAGGRTPDRNRLLVALARALEARFAIFAVDGFAPFAAEWRAADALRDRPATIGPVGNAPGPRRSGIARGVDLDGVLRFEADGIVTRILSGDLSLRPASP
jgi:BirA family transcriptional regulator, biotin operon repressor / biotin---[acetyl-CoA-carboxylase] ligase